MLVEACLFVSTLCSRMPWRIGNTTSFSCAMRKCSKCLVTIVMGKKRFYLSYALLI